MYVFVISSAKRNYCCSCVRYYDGRTCSDAKRRSWIHLQLKRYYREQNCVLKQTLLQLSVLSDTVPDNCKAEFDRLNETSVMANPIGNAYTKDVESSIASAVNGLQKKIRNEDLRGVIEVFDKWAAKCKAYQ